MAYQFPPDLQEFLDHELRSGEYESENHLFADLLRMLKEDREQALEGINEGLESMRRGEGSPAEQVFARLREKHNIPEDV